MTSNILMVTCSNCGNEVTPDKRVSMAGAAILSTFYMPYYYWIKKRHCPACGRDFTGDELRGYKDPDNTWKILSLILLALSLLGLGAAFQ